MSLFFGRGESRAMGSSWWSDVTGGRRVVTEDTAPRLAPVFAAQRHVIDYISTLPIDTFRNSGGSRTEASTPALLSDTDAPGGPGLEAWVGQGIYGILNGNAVGWISQTDGYGFPTRVNWLHWNDWSFDESRKQWYVFGQPVPASQLLHIPWLVPPGRTLGLSPIEHYAELAAAGMSAQEYADVKRGGGIPPAHLKNNKMTLDAEQSARVQSRAVQSFASGKPFVSGADWDLTLMSIPPNHAHFVETLKLSANHIAAVYGIDPTEVGGQAANSLTYSTEELRQIRRSADLRPYYTRFERAISRYLPSKQYIKFNVDATMRVDLKTRTEVTGLQIQDGRMSVNEARALEDRAPVANGDFHNVPAPKAEPTTRTGDTP